ncbi:hypothetical protein [Sphaerisporangium perillae]|uniref:hypothetical protein n=1 Tax=Sphaerisporangium perillae TaxID=2935860 RepID=UPI00200BCE78|nr:hypothetical protein [Sphaerisporangium perillae]
MARVLTTESTVTCGHVPPGTVVPQSAAKLAVGGKPVLVESGIKTIGTGCTVRAQGDVPCATVTAITGGRSAKLFAGGFPVMLDSLAGTTSGQISGVTGTLTVRAVQGRLAAT